MNVLRTLGPSHAVAAPDTEGASSPWAEGADALRRPAQLPAREQLRQYRLHFAAVVGLLEGARPQPNAWAPRSLTATPWQRVRAMRHLMATRTTTPAQFCPLLKLVLVLVLVLHSLLAAGMIEMDERGEP